MATIVTRAGKGSPLTHNEVDANFENLNSDKVETSSVSAFGATLIDDADAATARTTLGLGTAATTASTDYATAAQGALADSAVQPNDSPTFGSITVTGTVDGRDVAADGTKLDGIEAGATADQTASEILTAIKTVDGSGSGLDADLLDGQHGSYYLNTSTTFGGNVSGTYSAIVVADDSHNHVISNVDGLQTELDAKLNLSGGTMTGDLRLTTIRTSNGQEVIINAGESISYATGQTLEWVYVNAEGGLEVNSSPDNWGSGWAGRKTTQIKGDGITVDGNPAVVSGTIWSTPSRSGGTTYQNTTGHTLFIIIDSTGNGDYAQVSTNGTSWLNVYNWAGGTGSYERNSLTLVLPDGYYYRITGTAVYSWRELL